MKRREVNNKGEKERYTHLNAEFQRITRRDKAFLSDPCKEIKENNRMGKTRDLLKKIRGRGGSSQDVRGIGQGDHFLPYKFIERTIERRAHFTKQLLITS